MGIYLKSKGMFGMKNNFEAMKIQELRIGNKVSFKDTVVEIAGVSGIAYSFNAIDVTIFRGGKTEMHDLKTLSPIPLTEEILLKCGFERRGVYLGIAHVDTVYWYSPENQILYIEYTDSPFLEDEGTRYPVSSPIKHLHTLMNAIFDLTGEELEVKL